MNLKETIDEFVIGYDNPVSRRAYAYDLLQFTRWVGDVPLEQITPAMLKRWRIAQLDRGLAQATVDGRIRKLKAFWAWCERKGLVAANPARDLKLSRRRRPAKDKAAPASLIAAMLATVQADRHPLRGPRNRALLGLLLQYGVRRGDAASARLSRIGADSLILVVKGGRERILPLTGGYRAVLLPWLAVRRALPVKHDMLFTSVHRPYAPLLPGGIERIVRNLSRQSGGNIGPHAIRHHLGQTLADARVPPTVVQEILGHSDVKITLDYYYNQGDDRVLRVLEDFNPLSPPPSPLRLVPRSTGQTGAGTHQKTTGKH